MKKFKISYLGLLYNFVVGVMLAVAINVFFDTHINPLSGGLAAELISGVLSTIAWFTSPVFSESVFRAGLLKEIWISRLMELYYPVFPWLARAQDFSGNVDYNTINLAGIGADPAVLINNTTYPVPYSNRTDVPLALPLDYYDTEGTVVYNAEQRQLAYNKMDTVVKQHGYALAKAQSAKAAWNFAPTSNAALTPVQLTLGYPKSTYAAGVRLPFAFSNLIAAAQAFDALNLPQDGRVFVLSQQHKQDLLNQDVNLFKGFTDYKTGMIGQLYGWDIYVSTQCPTYNNTAPTAPVKNAYGAAPAGTDANSSFFFLANEVMRAVGTMDMFSRLRDPEAKGDIVNFQQRFVALSIRNQGQGAIVDYIAPTGGITNP